MNQQDRTDFAKLCRDIEALTRKADALEKLEEVTPALVELARIQPTLTALADGYKAAGVAGNVIKWIAGVATACVVLWALVRLVMFGDPK
jgi:hypothetical protein